LSIETFVVDTNVLLSDGNLFKKMGGKEIVVPLIVVEELDKHKTFPGDVGANARAAIRYLEDSIRYGDLLAGVETDDGVKVKVEMVSRIDGEKPDDTIIRTAKSMKRGVTILSNDAHLRIKAHIEGLVAVKHTKDLFAKEDGSYSGVFTVNVSSQTINLMYQQGFVELPDLEELPINSFVLLKSEENEKQTGVVRVVGNGRAEKISTNKDVFGIRAKNLEQSCAVELLLDTDVPLVTLVGGAGSGKTLLALAAGLELVMVKKQYRKLVIIRPPIPMGRDIGFLPGSLEEKMEAWAGPIMDNLEVLLNTNIKYNFGHLLETGMIEIAPPTFIRGRSLNNACILIDEAQSLTLHEIKTLVTRVGDNSKIILTGDIHQIDNPKVSAEDNGLTELFEAFKPYSLAGHVTLNKCERSGLASLAAAIL
jgi:PhoH-like ATPase